jgi:hypothetical protein
VRVSGRNWRAGYQQYKWWGSADGESKCRVIFSAVWMMISEVKIVSNFFNVHHVLFHDLLLLYKSAI